MRTQNYNVLFRKSTYKPTIFNQGTVEHSGKPNSRTREMTTCTVLKEDGEIVHEASVGRYYGDNPDNRVAREQSFRKVMKKFTDKETRKELWEGYIKAHPKFLKKK